MSNLRKFSDQQVLNMVWDYQNGHTIQLISEKYKASNGYVSHLMLGAKRQTTTGFTYGNPNVGLNLRNKTSFMRVRKFNNEFFNYKAKNIPTKITAELNTAVKTMTNKTPIFKETKRQDIKENNKSSKMNIDISFTINGIKPSNKALSTILEML